MPLRPHHSGIASSPFHNPLTSIPLIALAPFAAAHPGVTGSGPGPGRAIRSVWGGRRATGHRAARGAGAGRSARAGSSPGVVGVGGRAGGLRAGA